ncbi:MAG: polyprenyl synthetase family protein [Muribaculaceae bacterium]|nr:polyprenyl synthetase family protein [Muribaculaceae bacterium]
MSSILETIHQSIGSELRMLNERILLSLSSSHVMMNEIIEHYLRTKGKQIRPIIVLLSARMLGAIDAKVISAAAAVEMLHNASLIHDDVVDDSRIRRGEPTVNGIWDNHVAVLVGDYFVSTSLQLAVATGDVRIIGALAGLGRELSLGELDQVYNARFHKLTEQGYFSIIGKKTASLFVSCVEMGAYATGVVDERLSHLRRFAELMGLCFQIKDDIFDYYADERIGKPTGNDLREGKVTLPLMHVLLNENLPDHAAMIALSRKEVLDANDIEHLIEYAKANGGIDYAYSTMQRLRAEAVRELEVFPPSETRDIFISLFDFIINRVN